MTRKDYVALAAAIKAASDEFGEEGVGDGGAFDGIEAAAHRIADACAADNPRFDRARFLAACRG